MELCAVLCVGRMDAPLNFAQRIAISGTWGRKV